MNKRSFFRITVVSELVCIISIYAKLFLYFIHVYKVLICAEEIAHSHS